MRIPTLAGNGGNAGIQKVFVTTVEGNVELKSCGGNGAPAARNGDGGNGKTPATNPTWDTPGGANPRRQHRLNNMDYDKTIFKLLSNTKQYLISH